MVFIDHTLVVDSLSYIGFKAIHSFAASWSAQLHGEWRFDTADENNIASARRAYTAIFSPFGRLAIGKQRSVSYQFIADYIEMFNYSSNPLTYPPDTDFFIDNFVTYSDKYGPFSWIAGAKFNGSNDDKQSDLVNIGVSYDKKGLHAGVSYLSKERYSNAQLLGQDTAWAGTFVYQFHPRIYGALFYQAKRYQRTPEAADRNGFTADLSLSYQIMEHYKLTTRVIAFDNDFAHADVRNQAYTGHALTLEWQPSRPIRIHIEYLNKDFDNQPDINAISIGLRYDFRHRLQLK
ncbi:porin [Pseudoalteromonas sp. S16_S37]|uniref:porin n=1 Tax=Pseudoalteromonas sp. S16_S37 TaxID=2720228 RepID=UPI00168102E0|nr:porin [Pseudoalteromonas sp. S16_S37]